MYMFYKDVSTITWVDGNNVESATGMMVISSLCFSFACSFSFYFDITSVIWLLNWTVIFADIYCYNLQLQVHKMSYSVQYVYQADKKDEIWCYIHCSTNDLIFARAHITGLDGISNNIWIRKKMICNRSLRSTVHCTNIFYYWKSCSLIENVVKICVLILLSSMWSSSVRCWQLCL